MAATKAQKAEQQEAIDRLREWVKPGDVLYCILRHRSRSGTQRVIEIVQFDREHQRPMYLGYNAAKALGRRYHHDHEGVVVDGAGMDMGSHIVYELSHVLFPGGFGCIGDKCPSNDHRNGDRDYTPHSDATREIVYCDRTDPDSEQEVTSGNWGEYITTGARTFHQDAGPDLYLFDDEVLADAPYNGAHWHKNGEDALRKEWL